MTSTGRHHGYESLAEARLLLMLDFAGGVSEVLSQPMRLRFAAGDGAREHIPDFLADTAVGRWLINVRPADRIEPADEIAFAATARVAAKLGWGYAVVTGWKQPALATVDTLSAQRRPLTDPARHGRRPAGRCGTTAARTRRPGFGDAGTRDRGALCCTCFGIASWEWI